MWVSKRRGNQAPIRQAQFAIPVQTPPADPAAAPEQLQFDSPTTPEPLQALPPTADEGPALRSLLEPNDAQETPQTPFLPDPNAQDSPSDEPAEQPQPESFSPPKAPKSQQGQLDNCETIRNELVRGRIDKISLDVSPSFGVGPKSAESAQRKQEAFAEKAPIRDWYDYRGQFIVQGRLIDLRYDAIEIETASGTREAIYLRDLSDSDHVYVSESWWLPVSCGLASEDATPRSHVASTVTWRASGLCHKPLYFEEPQLERYGHEFGPIAQPIISTAHFFGNVAVLPYKMGIHPPTECQYALGYYRPGNCAPWYIPPVPISLRGAAAQASVVTGAAMVLP